MTSVARREHDDSGEYSDASQDIEHNNTGNDAGHPESDYDSQGSDSERSDGDPDNQEAEKRVDDDEDRSNPQYIPKRGTFYEHDDRTAASGEESTNTTSETASEKKEGSETPSERRRAPRKSEIINKWSHDKYNENEQMPKSRDELVSIYGYDIRNEDAPPHARRNRRYGRGPNKYTRTWEDEEAYKRQSAAQPQPRKPPNPDEFPELDAAGKKYGRKPRIPRPRSKSQPPTNEEALENGSPQLRRNASIKTPKAGKNERPIKVNVNVKSLMKPSPRPSPKDKMPPLENLTITTTVNNNQGPAQRRVNASVAQQRPVPTDQAKRKPQLQQPSSTPPNKSPPQPQPQQPKAQPQQTNSQQPPPQQTPAGPEARGSKRYSSLRQRPLADAYTPQTQAQPPQPAQQQMPQMPQMPQSLPQPQSLPSPQPQPQQQQQQQQPPQQPQQQIRYPEFTPGGAPAPVAHQGSPGPAQVHPPQMMHQVHRAPAGPVPPQHGPSPPHQQLPQPQHTQQVRLGLLEQQQLVSHPHPHMHNLPQPHSMGQLQPTQGYAPPAMMPAQYMQPPAAAPSGGVFGGAMYAQPPAPYPMYTPHHNYSTFTTPLSQATQAGGVTYYSCAEQEPPPQQPRTARRPTAAIPIVRPAAPERPANSTEKDNIDRIVENMFVRKPWPATHGADSKEKSIERNSQEPQTGKDSSQPNSLTSSSISTDSKPSESKEERIEDKSAEDRREEKEPDAEVTTPADA